MLIHFMLSAYGRLISRAVRVGSHKKYLFFSAHRRTTSQTMSELRTDLLSYCADNWPALDETQMQILHEMTERFESKNAGRTITESICAKGCDRCLGKHARASDFTPHR